MCILFLWTTVPLTIICNYLWISCGSPQNALWRKSSRHASTFDSYPHNFVLLPLLLPKPMDRNKYLFLSDKNAHRVLTALWIKKWKSGGKQKFIHSFVKTLLIFCGFPQREGIWGVHPWFCTATVGEALSLPPFPGAKHPWLHLWGVAERSESFKIMIAGGNHSTIKSWQPERAD